MSENDKLYELNGNVQRALAKLDVIQAGLISNSEALRKHIDWSSEEHKSINGRVTELENNKKVVIGVASGVGAVIAFVINKLSHLVKL